MKKTIFGLALVIGVFCAASFGASWQKVGNSPTANMTFYLSGIFKDGGIVLGADKLTITTPTATNKTYHIASTASVSSGKRYYEVGVLGGSPGLSFGLSSFQTTTGLSDWFASSGMYGYQSGAWGRIDGVPSSTGAGFTTGDVLGCAYDSDSGLVAFYKNGVLIWTHNIQPNTPLFAVFCLGASTADKLVVNFGGSAFSYLPSGYTGWNQ